MSSHHTRGSGALEEAIEACDGEQEEQPGNADMEDRESDADATYGEQEDQPVSAENEADRPKVEVDATEPGAGWMRDEQSGSP